MFDDARLRSLLAALFLTLLIGCGSLDNSTTAAGTPAPATIASTTVPVIAATAPLISSQASATALPTHAPGSIGAPTNTGQDTPIAAPTAPARATEASAESPLKRHDTPPNGVVAHLAKEYGALGFTCQALPDDSLGLRMTIYEAEHEIADGFSLCFSGFAIDQPIQVQITRPDGSVQHAELPATPPFGPEALDWVTLPGDPLGTYTIVAAQGAQQTTGSFTLRAASKPRMIVFHADGPIHSSAGSPGETYRIILAGFPPNSQVALHIYQASDPRDCPNDILDCLVYRTSLPLVHVDALGQGSAALQTQADDDGIFKLVSDPPAQNQGFDTIYIDRDNPLPDTALVAGQQAVTRPPFARDLWAAPSGTQRVDDRPKLYAGALVTILAVEPNAVRVRTEDDVEGWIHEPAIQALTSHIEIQGDRARFAAQTRVKVVWPNGIPLRAEPRPHADKLRAQLKAGQEAIAKELRGDWLKIALDDGTTGWARWYYDGAQYMEALLGP